MRFLSPERHKLIFTFKCSFIFLSFTKFLSSCLQENILLIKHLSKSLWSGLFYPLICWNSSFISFILFVLMCTQLQFFLLMVLELINSKTSVQCKLVLLLFEKFYIVITVKHSDWDHAEWLGLLCVLSHQPGS